MNATLTLVMAALVYLSVAIPTEAAQKDHRRVDRHAPLKVLPKAYQRIDHRGKSYFLANGQWYRQKKGVYVTITAPIGAVVPALPGGHITFGIGASRYFYHAGVYYQRGPSGYVVIKEPKNAEAVLAEGSGKILSLIHI